MPEAMEFAGPATASSPVEILILGAGWTSRFLIPLLIEKSVTHAATTTTGRDGTIPFRFDPDSASPGPYRLLPPAVTVLITFPLKGAGQSKTLTSLYHAAHPAHPEPRWIQLGSTGIFNDAGWNDASSPYDRANPRAVAEDELLASVPRSCVLNLAGLYDGATRDPRDWPARVARTKDAVRQKGALHLVHGADVARAVLALHGRFTPGKRWVVADLRVYDWWDLMQSWGAEARRRAGRKEGREAEADGLQYEKWVGELMEEEGVRALPRGAERLGRVLDSRAFWREMGIWPIMGRVV